MGIATFMPDLDQFEARDKMKLLDFGKNTVLMCQRIKLFTSSANWQKSKRILISISG